MNQRRKFIQYFKKNSYIKRKWKTLVYCGCVIGVVVLCTSLTGCEKTATENLIEENTDKKEYSEGVFAMDTYMSLTAYGSKGEEAVKAGIEEIERLDGIWSVGKEDSEVAKINQDGDGNISEDTVSIVKKALELSESTKHAFSMTVYPLMELWGFTSGDYQVPTKENIGEKLSLVDDTKVILDEENGKLSLGSGQQMDLGAIAKGFTSARIMEIWKEMGITSGMVSLGGNVQVLGSKPDGSDWKIGVQKPGDKEGNMLGVLSVRDCAVITSGGYERYFEEAGKTYHHILDTATGRPSESGLTSVTIVSNDGTLADGLSTALFVMGKEKAIAYWKKHKEEFDTILVEEDGTISITEGLQDRFETEEKVIIIEGV